MTDNSASGQVSANAARIYEQLFVPALFSQWPPLVLDAAGVRGGDRVIDVGCGTGVLTREAAYRVGPHGEVVGIDPNEGMLAMARSVGEPIIWQTGVAEELPFQDGRFDRLVSQFAMMFFTDRPKAVREMARVLRPAGTVGLAVWSHVDRSPGYARLAEIVSEMFGADAGESITFSFSLGNSELMRGLLATSFDEVRVEEHQGITRFPSIDEWVFTEIRGWTLADAIDDEQYERLLAEAKRRLGKFAKPNGEVEFPIAALIAAGAKQA